MTKLSKFVCFLSIFLILFLSNTVNLAPTNTKTKGSPVILVPGYGGNELFARLHNSSPPHFYCQKSSADFFLLWVNVEYLVPYAIECFIHHMNLLYDHQSRTTHPPQGVEVITMNWGDTATVEWLSSIKLRPTSYYAYLVDLLVKENNYIRNVSIRGAPFDFRKAPDENQYVLDNLKLLIEQTYYLNGDQRVVLVGHSLGCVYILHLLQHQTQSWKNKYIKAFVSASGVYGGSVESLRAAASGDNMNILTINPLWLRNMSRAWPATPLLFPRMPYWKPHEVLAMTNTRNYTALDYKQFYRDIGYPDGVELYKNVGNLTKPWDPPGVEVHCIYSTGVPTPAAYDWRGMNFPEATPSYIVGDGDGTVPIRSLKICSDWSGKQPQPVNDYQLKGTDHLDTIRSEEFRRYVQFVVTS